MREKIGRNDPCPCRSGLKYKKCHGRSVRAPETPSRKRGIENVPLRERNKILLRAIVDIFGLGKAKNLDELKSKISNEQIKHLYQVIAGLWPLNTNLADLLHPNDTTLRALYMGDVLPDQLVRNVCRFSLYADEILIVDPFHHPLTMREEFSPLVNPGQWKMDTLKLIAFAMFLGPWIEAGLVTLVPDPGNFDYSLRKKTWELAIARSKEAPLTEEDLEEFEPAAKEEFFRMVLMMPEQYLSRKVREAVPGISDEDVRNTLEHLHGMRRADPLALDQKIEDVGAQTMVTRTGANLELGMYLCHMTGAFPYTNLKVRWREILSVSKELPEDAQVWSPLTHAFQQLDFKFLNQVDPSFAYSLRGDGRLESFRVFLRRLWKEVGGEPDANKAQGLARDFGDELTAEYQKAVADWEEIDQSLLKQFGTTLLGGASAIVTGALNFQIPLAGVAMAGVLELLNSRLKRRGFRKKVPMSVLIDLSKSRTHA
jgi:hypothetical protein